MRKESKRETGKYGILAICMLCLMTGSLLLVEQQSAVSLGGCLLFCLVCSAVLLYCLMKLDVMEFTPGSFWDRINRQVQQEGRKPAGQKRQPRTQPRSTSTVARSNTTSTNGTTKLSG